ncbi:MAG: MreB/Mrl family cell shape determining protein [Candidatus Hydrogenedens sp.]|nr:MreB/Mrl family cell shape determining protein [Candidatus Hydrogenedens sp.]
MAGAAPRKGSPALLSIFRHLPSLFSHDMAIDLGTANTLVYLKGQGIVLSEPSVVAINKNTNEVRAVGNEAKKMIGRTPGNIVAIRPMKDGVIADFDIAEKMLRHFITKVHNNRRLAWPRVAISVPSGITAVERRAVTESAIQAGAKKVYIIEEPMAAAIGAGLSVHEPQGCMIVDIGGGTTEVAVISLGGTVCAKSVRVAGDDMDQAIIQHLKRTYNLMIGERTAEEIKIAIGSAFPMKEEVEMQVKGRDNVMSLPKIITITSEEIRESLRDPVNAIVDAVRVTLDRTPPELSADIVDRGVVLAGGGALLRGLDRLLAKETGLHVTVSEDPLTAVVLGTGRFLEELKDFPAEEM